MNGQPSSYDRQYTVEELLTFLYGVEKARPWIPRFEALIRRYAPSVLPATSPDQPRPWLSEKDAMLITYPDQVQEPGVPTLQTLHDFLQKYLYGLISAVHILPFFPFSSDDGFAVIDYLQVNPPYGTWEHIQQLSQIFRLMFDAVINHTSSQCPWFRAFLQDEPEFRDFYIAIEGNPDLSTVVRPRTTPLLTEFPSATGPRKIWTTFSADQVDLNYHNPKVLYRVIEILLEYTRRGASFLRLDAIAYLWKELGTSCIHLPQTHAVVQLIRAILDRTAPHVLLITETNVPHLENISYFGDGYHEAQLVYNFALPPLVLHAFLRQDATVLTQWAQTLRPPSPATTFFNFLASHDGIGLNPARGIVPESEIEFLVRTCLEHGGYVSHKTNPDGTESPYELNIVYFDALSNPNADEPQGRQVARFLSAHGIMLALAGMPGIYFHSLFGSRNDRAAVEATGIKRRINRAKFTRTALEQELGDPTSRRFAVFQGFRHLLQARQSHSAFAPNAPQRILTLHPGVFAVLRGQEPYQRILCLHNVTDHPIPCALPHELDWKTSRPIARHLETGIAPTTMTLPPHPSLTLEPYEVLWLIEIQREF